MLLWVAVPIDAQFSTVYRVYSLQLLWAGILMILLMFKNTSTMKKLKMVI